MFEHGIADSGNIHVTLLSEPQGWDGLRGPLRCSASRWSSTRREVEEQVVLSTAARGQNRV